MHGPRTQASGETNYLDERKTRFWTEPRHCMVLGPKPQGKPTTWMRKTRFWTEPRHCMVLGPKPQEKPTTWMRKTRFWTEPRHCMVLGPKPQGKPTTWMRNQLLKKKNYGAQTSKSIRRGILGHKWVNTLNAYLPQSALGSLVSKGLIRYDAVHYPRTQSKSLAT